MHVGSYRSALFGPQNTKKSLPKYSIADRSILNKRIYTNPKFDTISARTDSGFNARRKEELQKEIQKYYKISINEVFSRISLSDLMQLMIADSQECYSIQNNEEKNDELDDSDHNITVQSQQMSGLSVGERNPSSSVASSAACATQPYLLVDVRPPSDHRTTRLISSINHEFSRLSRSVNWECNELLLYRNKPDRIIIIYDNNEDIVPEYAYTLIHRGYENVYVLSGGLKLAKDKFGYPIVLDEMMQKRKGNDLIIPIKEKNHLLSSDACDEVDANRSSDVQELDLFSLSNKVLPLQVSDILTEQLSQVILPPLNSKGGEAEQWINLCASVKSSAGSSYTASESQGATSSTISTVRTARTAFSKKGISGLSTSGTGGEKSFKMSTSGAVNKSTVGSVMSSNATSKMTGRVDGPHRPWR
uniref:Centrosomal protein of 41 kDa-like n=1 Tax=Hirondellea gigas TaxID=1518452 RepID=A0A2P2ICQ4_9CRUS